MDKLKLYELWAKARAAFPDDNAKQNESFMDALAEFTKLVRAADAGWLNLPAGEQVCAAAKDQLIAEVSKFLHRFLIEQPTQNLTLQVAVGSRVTRLRASVMTPYGGIYEHLREVHHGQNLQQLPKVKD